VLFLTLRVFSATGGIEKVCKIVCKAITDIQSGITVFKHTSTRAKNEQSDNFIANVQVYSMYDATADVDEKYISSKQFKGFGLKKLAFSTAAIQKGIQSKIIIVSHINLLSLGFLIKLIAPKTKLVLFAHGIEVWEPLSGIRKWMLQKCDTVVCVSEFTKNTMIAANKLPGDKLIVLNNCLDPYLPAPITTGKSKALQKKYGIQNGDIVLITLTRLSSKELYKGYDHVLFALKKLASIYPNIKYLIVGNYDAAEKMRLDAIIEKEELNNHVIFTGYIQDNEIAEHYNLADVYVMPSKKEGFGIVFIEAMYYGLPVIAGNKDGSVDALLNGKLGLLVNPDNEDDINNAIQTIVKNKLLYKPDASLLMAHFSFDVYRQKLSKILKEV
jgi:glycosyltransferase involved in cell wall biosynthesis